MNEYEYYLFAAILVPVIAGITLGFGSKDTAKLLFFGSIITIISYCCVNYSNMLYWDYRQSLITSESTIEEQMDATADGGKNAFSLLFGWIPSFLAMIVIPSFIRHVRGCFYKIR